MLKSIATHIGLIFVSTPTLYCKSLIIRAERCSQILDTVPTSILLFRYWFQYDKNDKEFEREQKQPGQLCCTLTFYIVIHLNEVGPVAATSDLATILFVNRYKDLLTEIWSFDTKILQSFWYSNGSDHFFKLRQGSPPNPPILRIIPTFSPHT